MYIVYSVLHDKKPSCSFVQISNNIHSPNNISKFLRRAQSSSSEFCFHLIQLTFKQILFLWSLNVYLNTQGSIFVATIVIDYHCLLRVTQMGNLKHGINIVCTQVLLKLLQSFIIFYCYINFVIIWVIFCQ